MKLIPEIDAARAEIQTIRRDIHAHPELCFEEQRTADVVAGKLASWGIPIHRGLGKTGVVGIIKNGDSKRAIGLRADMDALPIQEVNTFDHASQHPGKMHACGHDGHTAMLLAAARYLQNHRNFDGTVYLIFQPAEEGGGGAREMIKDGLFEKFPMEAVFGMHNWPGSKVGTFGLTPGPMMASSNEFKITLTGKGTHAGIPNNGIDPVIAAVQVAQALQTIITRNKRPIDAAVLSITQIHAGDATNVVPDVAWLGGTVRTFSLEVLDLIEQRLRDIATHVARGLGCEAEVLFNRNYPPTINDDKQAAFCAEVMREIVGAENVDAKVEPTMGAEDFSFMLLEKPGCYVFIGNGDGAHRDSGHGLGPCNLHNASYDFNDDLLPLGGTYWVRLVEKYLSKN
ncbi:M20 aminoacylase family protein [Pandoraea sp.]|uniref:M20 aminoacylase family protein n=1 Tax=Pandoraea sp. TaxID=1883445 RepID=UPI00121D378D|nr:M20 aminoacylase family protein [Pandoraea sp.]TAL56700.1 MAG: amidohydrolase [Pandoraea sp.]TAM15521.1 MAG: amidohydrolase [Pandoraea sp.]